MALGGRRITLLTPPEITAGKPYDGLPLEGVEGSTVPGYIGARGAKAHLYPQGANCVTAVLPPGKTDGTPQKPTEKDDLLGYLDSIDKLFSDEAKSCLPPSTKNCGLWAIVGECPNCHRYAVRLFCGKPYCDICREIIHRRKIGRGLPKIQQIEAMAKFVIRPPDELQPIMRTKRQRAAFTKRVADAVIEVGYARLRWFKHDFGEGSTKYAFHLEIIVDGGYLPEEVLDELKRKLRRLIYSRREIEKWGDKLDIWYGYYQTPGQMYHALYYATHPTFTDIAWDRELARELKGERYSGYRGNWKRPAKWQLSRNDGKLQSLVTLEQGNCPKCGQPIKWDKRPTPFVLVLAEGGTPITAGYYELLDARPPPVLAAIPTNLTELPDDDYRKHPNVIRRSIDRAREHLSFLADLEASK